MTPMLEPDPLKDPSSPDRPSAASGASTRLRAVFEASREGPGGGEKHRTYRTYKWMIFLGP